MSYGIIYLDTKDGDDRSNGYPMINAVKTYARALELATPQKKIRLFSHGPFFKVFTWPHEWSSRCRSIRRKLNKAWRR